MCRTIPAEQVTVFLAVPTVMKMLVDHLEQPGADRYDFSSLRHVLYGSNPIAPTQLRAFAGLFGCSLSQIGGIGTEGGVGLSLSRVDHDRGLRDPAAAHILQSCGRIQPGAEMRLVDEGGQEVPTGEIGEMVFRGDAYVAGYWNRPEASRLLWREGWLHSGDLGRRDAEGYVYYVDRKAGRIKTGGETVFAREVEAVLGEHPAVGAVAVVGVPDEKWGEAICAVVQPRDGVEPDEELAAELQEHVRQRLARFKVPRRVVFRAVLPTTALGKIAVGRVRALAVDAAAADSRSGIGATA
jgi:acyl-CoA synthetase (AMP-forming)/AMP-acid ligase II